MGISLGSEFCKIELNQIQILYAILKALFHIT